LGAFYFQGTMGPARFFLVIDSWTFSRRRSQGHKEACSVGCGKNRDSEGSEEAVGEGNDVSESEAL
jgi:hypothetical protein